MAFPMVDFSPLGDLGKIYQEARTRRQREDLFKNATLDGSPKSLADLATKSLQAGDIQTGMTLANLARTYQQDDFERTYKTGMLDVARQQANRKDAPTIGEIYHPESGLPQKALVTPSGVTPIGGTKRKEQDLTATDKKAIFEAEDEGAGLKTTIEALQRAKDLNAKTYTGLTAGLRATIGSRVPGAGYVMDKDAADATTEWQSLMGEESIKTMAATLKGATTDFELRTYVKLLGDPSTPPEIRQKTIERLQTLAQRKMEINQNRMDSLRGGTYYKPGGDKPGGTKPAASLPRVTSPAEAAKLPKGTRFLDPNGVERIVP